MERIIDRAFRRNVFRFRGSDSLHILTKENAWLWILPTFHFVESYESLRQRIDRARRVYPARRENAPRQMKIKLGRK